MGISVTQLIIILVIVIVLFGTRRLRDIGGDLGNAIKGFRSAVKDGNDDNKITEEESHTIDSEVSTEQQEKVEK